MLNEYLQLANILEQWMWPLISLVLFVKLVLFFIVKADGSRVYEFFYYRDSHIINCYSFRRVSLKIIQNCLSFYLLFLIFFYSALLLT